MDPLQTLALGGAGLAAGFLNALVGSGSLFTFPVLLALGFPPVAANITNTMGLAIGNISGALGYRRELRPHLRVLTGYAAVTIAGATLGAVFLLALPAESFERVAPYLIGLGCLLVALQPVLASRISASHTQSRGSAILSHSLTLGTGIYGGYFGAAQGVLIMGILGLTTTHPIAVLNGIKNTLQALAGLVASAVFLLTQAPDWHAVATIAVASLAGGMLGARVGRRLSPLILRLTIVVVGIAAIISFAL